MLKEEILYALEREKGAVVTGGQLAEALGVSRTAVWKSIRALRAEGNDIIALPNSGYLLAPTNDTLSEKSIRARLNTGFIGRAMTVLPVVHSTNQYLKEMDAADTPNGYTVVADEQTAGRGRKNRPFLSPKGAGVYCSVLLKPNGQRRDIRLLTVYAAAAVSTAIEKICGVPTAIKWVNDIFCGGKKICGILTEATLCGELREWSTVIIGVGINTGAVPSAISHIATSTQEAAGARGVRNLLVSEICNQLEAVWLDCASPEGQARAVRQYRDHLFVIGRQVTVIQGDRRYAATVLDMDTSGALVVRDTDGAVQHITSGEIILEPIDGGLNQ